MPTIYGTVDILALVRSTISTHLNALKTAMTSGSIVPALAAVYDDHFGTLALVFNSVSIGVESAENPYIGPSTGNHRTDFLVKVNLRVMIGNTNTYKDEAKYHQLCQSIMNYFETKRILYDVGTERVVWLGGIEIRPLREFDDTRTIGGEMVFVCRASATYTSA